MKQYINTWVSRILGCVLLSVLAVQGQTANLTLSGVGQAYPGATLAMTVTLSGSSGQSIDGIGFTLPAGFSAPVLGAASTTATKTLWSSTGGTVLLIGDTSATPPVITNAIYGDGAILTFAYTVPASAVIGSPLSVSIGSPMGATPAGLNVAMTTTPFTATVGYAPTCLTAISANVTAYLATPTIALLGKIVAELASAAATGTCQ